MDNRHKVSYVQLSTKTMFKLYAQSGNMEACLTTIKSIPVENHLPLLLFLEHRKCYETIFDVFSTYYENEHVLPPFITTEQFKDCTLNTYLVTAMNILSLLIHKTPSAMNNSDLVSLCVLLANVRFHTNLLILTIILALR